MVLALDMAHLASDTAGNQHIRRFLFAVGLRLICEEGPVKQAMRAASVTFIELAVRTYRGELDTAEKVHALVPGLASLDRDVRRVVALCQCVKAENRAAVEAILKDGNQDVEIILKVAMEQYVSNDAYSPRRFYSTLANTIGLQYGNEAIRVSSLFFEPWRDTLKVQKHNRFNHRFPLLAPMRQFKNEQAFCADMLHHAAWVAPLYASFRRIGLVHFLVQQTLLTLTLAIEVLLGGEEDLTAKYIGETLVLECTEETAYLVCTPDALQAIRYAALPFIFPLNVPNAPDYYPLLARTWLRVTHPTCTLVTHPTRNFGMLQVLLTMMKWIYLTGIKDLSLTWSLRRGLPHQLINLGQFKTAMLDMTDAHFVPFYRHLFTMLNAAWPTPMAVYSALQSARRIDTMDEYITKTGEDDELRDCASIFTALEGMVFVKGTHAVYRRTIRWLYEKCCATSDAIEVLLLRAASTTTTAEEAAVIRNKVVPLITTLYEACEQSMPQPPRPPMSATPAELYDAAWLTLDAGSETGHMMMQYYLMTLLPIWTPPEVEKILLSARLAPVDKAMVKPPKAKPLQFNSDPIRMHALGTQWNKNDFPSFEEEEKERDGRGEGGGGGDDDDDQVLFPQVPPSEDDAMELEEDEEEEPPASAAHSYNSDDSFEFDCSQPMVLSQVSSSQSDVYSSSISSSWDVDSSSSGGGGGLDGEAESDVDMVPVALVERRRRRRHSEGNLHSSGGGQRRKRARSASFSVPNAPIRPTRLNAKMYTRPIVCGHNEVRISRRMGGTHRIVVERPIDRVEQQIPMLDESMLEAHNTVAVVLSNLEVTVKMLNATSADEVHINTMVSMEASSDTRFFEEYLAFSVDFAQDVAKLDIFNTTLHSNDLFVTQISPMAIRRAVMRGTNTAFKDTSSKTYFDSEILVIPTVVATMTFLAAQMNHQRSPEMHVAMDALAAFFARTGLAASDQLRPMTAPPITFAHFFPTVPMSPPIPQPPKVKRPQTLGGTGGARPIKFHAFTGGGGGRGQKK